MGARERRPPAFLTGGGEMGALIRSRDWSATAFGPLDRWPPALRTVVGVMLGASAPMAVCWGRECLLLYNDLWRDLIGDKHPEALGRPARAVFPETIWDDIGPRLARVLDGRGSDRIEDFRLPVARRGRVEDAWFSFGFDAIPLEDGSIGGVLESAADTTQRVLAEQARAATEAALREGEARTRLAMRATGLVTWEWFPAQDRVVTSDGLAALYGVPAVAGSEEGFALVLPHDAPAHIEKVQRVAREGGSFTSEFRIRRPDDGRIVWMEERGEAQLGADGAVERVLGVVFDVTARKRVEEALRESEARFREFGDASSDALWIRSAETLEWEYLSAAFETIYGLERERALASRSVRTLLDVIVPEDRERTLEAIRRLRDGEGDYEYRIRRPSDGQLRWLRTTGFPLLDTEGGVRRLGGITRDVTEERRTADRMDVLVAELQHRTRNIIGVVRAIAKRTQRASGSLEEFSDRFVSRLDALARANGLLSRLKEGDRVAFDELLEAELRGHGIAVPDYDDGRVALSGPCGIRLRSASVQTLALALHELVTNATKHGALGRSGGRLTIEWRVVDPGGEPRLRVEWRESWETPLDVARVNAAGRGYGRELIERAIPFQLGAQTSYDLRPDGLTCVIDLPMTRRGSA